MSTTNPADPKKPVAVEPSAKVTYKDPVIAKRIINNFKSHAVSEQKLKHMDQIRKAGELVSNLINASVPNGREKSEALTLVESAIMWANAGISRNE